MTEDFGFHLLKATTQLTKNTKTKTPVATSRIRSHFGSFRFLCSCSSWESVAVSLANSWPLPEIPKREKEK